MTKVPLTSANLLRTMHVMQAHLKGVELNSFGAIADGLRESDATEAAAVMRGTIMWLTVMHDEIEGTPSLLTKGCNALALVHDLISAVDLDALAPVTREALIVEVGGIWGDEIDEMPQAIAEIVTQRRAKHAH